MAANRKPLALKERLPFGFRASGMIVDYSCQKKRPPARLLSRQLYRQDGLEETDRIMAGQGLGWLISRHVVELGRHEE